jgi:acyl carrier protein
VIDDLEKRVRALVAKVTGERIERISLKTRIVQDIGCDGADAEELFDAFAKQFDVDLSDIQWERHFSHEATHPLGCFLWMLVGLFGWSARSNMVISDTIGDKLEPISVGDLVEGARATRWVKSHSKKD